MNTNLPNHAPEQSRSSLVITVNTRLSRELRRRYDREQIANGSAVWVAPDILPLHAWLERCWREWLYAGVSTTVVHLLNAAQERAIWEDIVGKSEEGRGLLQVAGTAEAALDAWDLLHAWGAPLDAPEWGDSKDTEAFRRWAEEFQRRCQAGEWLSGAQLTGFVAEKIDAKEMPAPRVIQLAGFNELAPAVERLLDSLRRNGSSIEAMKSGGRQGIAGVVRAGFPDAEAEMRAAAQWARQAIEGGDCGRTKAQPVGIVVPELARYRKQFESIFAETLHPNGQLCPEKDAERAFNISLGPGLAEYPLIQAALLLLQIQPAGVPFDDAGRWIRSPFIEGAEAEFSERAQLDAHLRSFREPEFKVSEIIRLAGSRPGCACPILAKCLLRWSREYSDNGDGRAPGDWAPAFSGLLKAMGWPGGRKLTSAEHQTLMAWNDLLAEFASLDSVAGSLNFRAALSMLKRMAASRQFQPESEAAPIQALGVFEASGMEFEHLWIMGLHDGAWPRSGGPNPFLPLRLQRERNMPASSASRELEFTKLLTAQLLACSPDIVLSHPQREGDLDLRPSPLFPGVTEVTAETLGFAGAPRYVELIRQSATIETIQDDYAPPWVGTLHRGGTSIFTHQAACPFRAFAHMRLGVETLESARPGLSPLDRGNLVHVVFQKVWEELRSHESLMRATPEFLSAVVRDQVAATIAETAQKKLALQRPRFVAIEQKRLERLTLEWLELEKQRQPFTVLDQEQDRKVTIGGIDLTIRADRIDRLGDGTHVVLDYKTATHNPKEWEGPRPDQPQLPLYAITSDTPPSGVFYGVAKLGELQFKGLTVADGIVPRVKVRPKDPSLAEQLENWRDVLEHLAEDFRNGKASVDPKNPAQSCRYCGLHGLCRISEAAYKYDEFEESRAEGSID